MSKTWKEENPKPDRVYASVRQAINALRDEEADAEILESQETYVQTNTTIEE